ncbi:flagellar biosynthesis protein FlhF [Pontibacillus salicampi]|uniref:Flagellar biosynthesis protein FlhF n=1 Tax=Pontibacillus salicampi TaxID=1449801 RepID=A0ABV6LP24_9BACI
MKVKKFIAPTMLEVMSQVRKELGTEAVILNSKEIKKGGIFGFFSKTNIEVVAAIDPEPARWKQKEPKADKSIQWQAQPAESEHITSSSEKALQRDIEELRTVVQQQQRNQSYPLEIQKLYEELLKQEVSAQTADTIVQPLVEKFYVQRSNGNELQLWKWMKEELYMQLEDVPFGGMDYTKQIVHFVGPTGVGKTTTIAKVAANAVMNDHKQVAFITTDTYRIAAIDQLKTYAKILDLPLEVAYNKEDYQLAKEKFSSYDLVLVDTAGRNYRDTTYVEELKDMVEIGKDTDTYLVLSLTSKVKDMEDIYNTFATLPIKNIIFTKADETTQYGGVLDLVMKHEIGVAYVTDGQNVPDDLRIASGDWLIDQIVGDIEL